MQNKVGIVLNVLKVAAVAAFAVTALPLSAEVVEPSDTTREVDLSEVAVVSRKPATTRMKGAINGEILGKETLFRAACCNLGESFVTNPSVDVTYSDAATGARQIKLLGLAGTYVQMLTENLPNFRGLASAYSLGYVPGPWMKSIQVSKGASSVRNGYESITGQIDIEYLKPDDEQGATANLYFDSKLRLEANADANIHLSKATSTELLAHYENNWGHHDENHDGFLDKPNVRQVNVQNRWKVFTDKYIFHGGLGVIDETRRGGQTEHAAEMSGEPRFPIDVDTRRYEGYMKHAFIIDRDHGTNIALMTQASLHDTDALFGEKVYDAKQKNVYAQLLFENNFSSQHNLSAGASINYDCIDNHGAPAEKETSPGVYAQYTYTLDTRLTAMAGIRFDHSSVYGSFITPRFHVKYSPSSIVSLRASAGKGYRSPHALAENFNLLASGRTLVIATPEQERAWNYGVSTALYIPIANKTLRLNAEYYYTNFEQQTIIDYDITPSQIVIHNLDGGKSYSHTFQVDATYPFFDDFSLTAAYRLNDVKATYGNRLLEKPLNSKYKALFSASYKTPLELWQFDVTLQLNGGGRIPAYAVPNGPIMDGERFKAYEQLSAQITRWFRHFSVYVGGENLTGFRQKNPILCPQMPWSQFFDPTLVWGPVHGAMFYAGIRLNFGRL